jgi:hypothetical protein
MARARDCEIRLLASWAKVVAKRWPDAKQLLADIDAKLHALIEEELHARPERIRAGRRSLAFGAPSGVIVLMHGRASCALRRIIAAAMSDRGWPTQAPRGCIPRLA